MTQVDRALFVRHEDINLAYIDAPLSIGFEVTISAPHMHACALKLLATKLVPGNKFLDVGSGSGIMCAYAARMMDMPGNSKSTICGLESLPGVLELSKKNLEKFDASLMEEPNFQLLVGDGWKGHAESAPYDAIHVGAAAEGIPTALLNQLAEGGLMMLPYEAAYMQQFLLLITKKPSPSNENSQGDGGLTQADMRKLINSRLTKFFDGGKFEVNIPGSGLFEIEKITEVAFVPLVRQD